MWMGGWVCVHAKFIIVRFFEIQIISCVSKWLTLKTMRLDVNKIMQMVLSLKRIVSKS